MKYDEKERLGFLGGFIERHLLEIEKGLTDEYKLTLVARHTSRQDADIILSMDDLESVIAAIRNLQNRPDRVIEPS